MNLLGKLAAWSLRLSSRISGAAAGRTRTRTRLACALARLAASAAAAADGPNEVSPSEEFRALAHAPVVTNKAVVQVQTKTRLHINADTANEVDDLYTITMDIQAIEVVLNANDLETHIMPVNVASALVFDLDEVRVKLAGRNDLLGLLCRRWQDHVDGSRRQRTIGDLSGISCLVHPEFGEEISAQTPSENTPREVRIYSKIDGRRMRDEFFAAVAEHCGLELREAQAGTRDGGARGN